MNRMTPNLLAAAIGLALSAPAHGQVNETLRITTNADGGAGSLRNAVQIANAQVGPDRIEFAPGLGPIRLSSELVVADSLTMVGGASGQVIDAQGLSRILRYDGALGTGLRLERLVLQNGRTLAAGALFDFCSAGDGRGGAVCVRGDLTLDEVVIRDSRTTGIAADGGAVFVASGNTQVFNSVISGNRTEGDFALGGGISQYRGELALENSVIVGNTATQGQGGGVSAVDAGLLMRSSTLALNTALAGGGAYLYDGIGSQANVFNSTISGNEASSGDGGALRLNNLPLSLKNSTVTQNLAPSGRTGGIHHYATAARETRLYSSILAGNGADNFQADGASVMAGASYSLWGDAPAELDAFSFQNVSSNNPGVTVLADFDCAQVAGIGSQGRCVPVHGLAPGSLAIDAGANLSALPFDQRGFEFMRVNAGQADIGAYERQAAPALIVSNNADAGPGSLRAMVDRANRLVGVESLIGFQPGLPEIVLERGQIEIRQPMRIVGPGSAQSISGGQRWRIFGVTDPNAPLLLENLVLRQGRASLSAFGTGYTPNACSEAVPYGGAICSLGDVTIASSSIRDNRTEGDFGLGGGALVIGNLTLRDSRVAVNDTFGNDAFGAGLAVLGGAVIRNSVIDDNWTRGSNAPGGGLFAEGTVTIEASTISNNRTLGSDSRGGGLYLLGDSSLSNVTVSNNETTGVATNLDSSGGGIFAAANHLRLRNSTITGNSASEGAGGLAMLADYNGAAYVLELDSVILAGNTGPAGNFAADALVSVTADASLDGDGELPGVNLVSNMPNLGPLRDNSCAVPAGAPTLVEAECVRTHLPLPGSPALDNGSNPEPALNTDQRGSGFPRRVGPEVDIGAIESDPDSLFRDGFE